MSANAPLIQRWFSFDNESISPYKLYALSNVGSLLGLLLYPFVIEPFVSLDNQLMIWSVGFWLFAACCVLLAGKLVLTSSHMSKLITHAIQPASGLDKFVWIVLSSIGVIVLLAVTSSMSQNISSIPFLWLLPLALYLMSFIVCFASDVWIARKVWYGGLLLSLPITFLLYFFASLFPLVVQVVLYSFVLISVCMVCHGELVRLKPTVDKLTSYYLAMSIGGVLGGLFVSFIAPVIFNQFIEFPLIVWLCFLIGTTLSWRELKAFRIKIMWTGSIVSTLSLGIFLFVNAQYQQYDVISDRNFYGQLAVKDIQIGDINERRLVDGTTSHGTQSLDEHNAQTPLSYYRENTGVAAAIETLQQRDEMNVAIIGLGAGTLAAYGRTKDTYHFLELNPMVSEFAHEYFTYIEQSKADVDIRIGDGRQLLNDNESFDDKSLDLLVIDAFSSDAIPVHLLTTQAMSLYKKRIADNGIIAIHISNSHLDLVPLVYGLGHSQKLFSQYVLTKSDDKHVNMAQWVLLSKQADVLTSKAIFDVKTAWPVSTDKPIIWSDDYSNLLSVLK